MPQQQAITCQRATQVADALPSAPRVLAQLQELLRDTDNGIKQVTDLMRRDTGEHPNGLLDYALCQTIEHLREQGAKGLSLNFAAFRSILDGEKGDGVTQRVERWGLRRLSSVLPIETLWRFNEKYLPTWLARHLVYSSPEQFVPTVAAAMRAESLADIPLLGRFLAQDPANRPGMQVPAELLEGRPVGTDETTEPLSAP